MSTINTYYVLGSSLTDDDMSYVQGHNTIFKTDETLYFGTDYGLVEVENLLKQLQGNETETLYQIFLIGGNPFPLNFFKSEESFLRRYPVLAKFLKYATDGTERDAYSMHKKNKNVQLYIINLYTVHETNLILQL
ncbi:MAG: hypothetical protein CMH46_00480 [Muricauda sp.]|nr:hypothetical protein [Allomuricauda sp.]